MTTKDDIFQNYTPPSYINREPAPETSVEESSEVSFPWFEREEGRENTYTSESLQNYNTQQQLQVKSRLDALRRFLDEAVSKVDLPSLTIQSDDKGEL